MGGAWEWFGHGRLNYAMIYSSLEWKFTHYYWWREEGKAARQFRNGWQQIPPATVTLRKCNSIPRLENFGWWAAKPPSPRALVHRCSGVVIVVTIVFACFSIFSPIIFHFLPVPCPFHRCHTPRISMFQRWSHVTRWKWGLGVLLVMQRPLIQYEGSLWTMFLLVSSWWMMIPYTLTVPSLHYKYTIAILSILCHALPNLLVAC